MGRHMNGHKLEILKITEYKGFHILIQKYKSLFQFVLFKDGKFYQGYHIITPDKGTKTYSQEDLVTIAVGMLDYAFEACDAILKETKSLQKESN
jgi:hypothetical protein